MSKKTPNQIIHPPKLFIGCGFLMLVCIKVGTWLPPYAQPLEGAAFILMGGMIFYAISLLPYDWLEKANEGVIPFYKIPKGGKHIKGFVIAFAAVLVLMGAVRIALWGVGQLNL
jgi:hypothetical protein